MLIAIGFLAFLGGVVFAVIAAVRFLKYRKLGKEICSKKLRFPGRAFVSLLIVSVLLMSVGGMLEENSKAPIEIEGEKQARVDSKDDFTETTKPRTTEKVEITVKLLEQKVKELEGSPLVEAYMNSPEIQQSIAERAAGMFEGVQENAEQFAAKHRHDKALVRSYANELPTYEDCLQHAANFRRISKAAFLAAESLRDAQGRREKEEARYLPLPERSGIKSAIRHVAGQTPATVDELTSALKEAMFYLSMLPKEVREEAAVQLVAVEGFSKQLGVETGTLTGLMERMCRIVGDEMVQGVITTHAIARMAGVSMDELTRDLLVGNVEHVVELTLRALDKGLTCPK
jgi:hypothetical protein